jgi:hypothetical protein
MHRHISDGCSEGASAVCFEGQTLNYLDFWSIFGAQGIFILIGFNSRIQVRKCPYFLQTLGYLIFFGNFKDSLSYLGVS